MVRNIGTLVTFGVIIVGFFAYMAGLYSGAFQCQHRCYWCGQHLQAQPPGGPGPDR